MGSGILIGLSRVEGHKIPYRFQEDMNHANF